MAPVTSPARHAGSLATSASNRERRQSKVHRAMEWPKPSSVRSNVTMSASVRARMHRPSCTSSQLGLITTTRFTPTRLSDIVHPVSSSQLTEARDRCPVVRGLQHTQSMRYDKFALVLVITAKTHAQLHSCSSLTGTLRVRCYCAFCHRGLALAVEQASG